MTSSVSATLRAAAITALLASSGVALAQAPTASDRPALQPSVETVILDGKGEKIGTASIKGGANATVLRLEIAAGGLPPGWHGAHFHAVGDCSDPAKFELSKAHVNHMAAKHGLLNPDGPDEGDLPNVYVSPDGSAHAELSTRTKLDGANGLRDQDGSALILHANADDHATQPIGGAGARIACAIIK